MIARKLADRWAHLRAKPDRGSTLVITMVLIMVVAVMLVGFQVAVMALANRVADAYDDKQAYLMARSAVTAVVDELENQSAEEFELLQNDSSLVVEPTSVLLVAVTALNETDTLVLDNTSFHDADALDGEVAVTITLQTTETYLVTAIATVGDATESVSMTVTATENLLIRTSESTTELSGSYAGIYSDFGTIFDKVKTDDTPSVALVSTGVLILDDEADLYSSIYCDGDIILSGEDIKEVKDPNEKDSYTVEIFATGDITLSGKVTLENVDIRCNGTLTISGKVTIEDSNIQCDTLVTSGSNYSLSDNTVTTSSSSTTLSTVYVPSRSCPTWVDDAEATIASGDYVLYTKEMASSKTSFVGGTVYLLDDDVETIYGNKTSGISDDNPAIIVIPSGFDVEIVEKCSSMGLYIWLQGDAELTVDPDKMTLRIYGDPASDDLTAEITEKLATCTTQAQVQSVMNSYQSQLSTVIFKEGDVEFTGTITVGYIVCDEEIQFNYDALPSGESIVENADGSYSSADGSTAGSSSSGGESGSFDTYDAEMYVKEGS